MSDSKVEDSHKPIHSMSPDAIGFIEAHKAQILDSAKVAGVSPTALAGPIAREMTRRETDHWGVTMAVRDEQSRQNALFYTTSSPITGDPMLAFYSHQDYVDDMKAVKGGVQRGGIDKAHHIVVGATDHPVLNDLPPANIRPVAAIKSLEFYLKPENADKFKGDPFHWKQYEGHYDKFVQDLAMPVNGKQDSLSIQISAVNAANIDKELSKNVTNWQALTEDQRAAAITAYSASGGKQFDKEQPFKLDPNNLMKTDGANFLLAPFEDGTPTNARKLHQLLGDTQQLSPRTDGQVQPSSPGKQGSLNYDDILNRPLSPNASQADVARLTFASLMTDNDHALNYALNTDTARQFFQQAEMACTRQQAQQGQAPQVQAPQEQAQQMQAPQVQQTSSPVMRR